MITEAEAAKRYDEGNYVYKTTCPREFWIKDEISREYTRDLWQKRIAKTLAGIRSWWELSDEQLCDLDWSWKAWKDLEF